MGIVGQLGSESDVGSFGFHRVPVRLFGTSSQENQRQRKDQCGHHDEIVPPTPKWSRDGGAKVLCVVEF